MSEQNGHDDDGSSGSGGMGVLEGGEVANDHLSPAAIDRVQQRQKSRREREKYKIDGAPDKEVTEGLGILRMIGVLHSDE